MSVSTKFKIIEDYNNIPFLKGWEETNTLDFTSKIVVDAQGKKIGADSTGRHYRIVSEQEKIYSKSQRSRRHFWAVISIIFTLGLAAISSKVRNLFKDRKVVAYGINQEKVEDLEAKSKKSIQELEEVESKNEMGALLNEDAFDKKFSSEDEEKAIEKSLEEAVNQRKELMYFREEEPRCLRVITPEQPRIPLTTLLHPQSLFVKEPTSLPTQAKHLIQKTSDDVAQLVKKGLKVAHVQGSNAAKTISTQADHITHAISPLVHAASKKIDEVQYNATEFVKYIGGFVHEQAEDVVKSINTVSDQLVDQTRKVFEQSPNVKHDVTKILPPQIQAIAKEVNVIQQVAVETVRKIGNYMLTKQNAIVSEIPREIDAIPQKLVQVEISAGSLLIQAENTANQVARFVKEKMSNVQNTANEAVSKATTAVHKNAEAAKQKVIEQTLKINESATNLSARVGQKILREFFGIDL